MLNLLIREFLAICDFLLKNNIEIHKGCLPVRREVVEELLSRNLYETADRKLHYWKALGWIDTEPRRLTKRVYDNETRHYYPYVMIVMERYQCMKTLSGTG